MSHSSLSALVALTLVLSACATAPTPRAPAVAALPAASAAQRGGQLELALASGSYRCDNGLRVQVEREVSDRVNRRVHIGWKGSSYWLERDPSYSGLPRFQDSSSGLVWIDLPWKSLLLDAKTQKPLADECRSI